MLNKSIIIASEVAMPILQTFAPSPGRTPVAAPAAGAPHAARRYGMLPMPALEWNARVER
jgi:hypothetical protein